ncbi:MAG: hypothetical protein JXR07_10245 [Reichenbachiella sp.]
MNNRILLLTIFALSLQSVHAQDEQYVDVDSVLKDVPGIETFQSKSKLDPNKATLYSAVIPGLGQIYNKQYWKLPILYGGAILIGHYIKYNNDFYNAFRNAWIAETDNNPNTENPFSDFPTASLQRNAEQFRRDRDFLIIIGVVYYLLNIVDAHVAAHLMEFDMNSDLAITPTYQQSTRWTTRNVGLSLRINLSK